MRIELLQVCVRQFLCRPRCSLGAPCAGLMFGGLLMLGALESLAAEEPEEEAAVVVGDEEVVVSETGGGDAGWNARPIVLRPVGDQQAFVRHSSEAYGDADDRLNLELKYYFDLPADLKIDPDASRPGPLSRGAQPAPAGKLSAGPQAAQQAWSAALPLPLDGEASDRSDDVEWLDYHASAKPKLIAAVLANRAADKTKGASLLVARVAPTPDGLEVDKQVATRELDAAELPADCLPGGLLDAWDRPKSLGSRAMFLGRVVAVLKQFDDRYAVDFYGETLDAESDCRVWLWRQGSSLGRPVGIRFAEIPIKKGPDAVSNVCVMTVVAKGSDNALHTIAFDYPLCRPAIMAQMQRAAAQSNTPNRPGPDLEKIVGADLLDEFARRLVNGTYR